MTARSRTLLLAAALAVAIVGAAAGIVRFAVSRRAVERALHEERGSPLLAVDPARAVAVRIAAGGEEVRLVREGSSWSYTAPAPGRADAAAVRTLLEQLASLRRRATSAPAGMPPERLRPYGLDAPRRRLEVTLEGGRVASLAIGGTTELEGVTFVMPSSGDVAMVAASAREDLDRAADALRIGAIVPLAPAPGPAGPAPARGGDAPVHGG